ncbi:MAG: type IV pilin-like G/H family protein [Crocosphaera sp.]|nr:type IV pilin-like G/H family protein [Crocosphaera sp.]
MNSSTQKLSTRYPPKHLFQSLLQSNQQQGFTLIELLVVILIIGILGAIALPQMLQIIGRSRESEARSMMGAMNRAQQAYFNEKATFAQSAVELEVPVGNEKHYIVFVDPENDFAVGGLQGAKGKDNRKYGTRDYAAAVSYDPVERTYDTVVCRSIDQANNYEIDGLASFNPAIGSGRVAGATGGTSAQCVENAGVETVEELR